MAKNNKVENRRLGMKELSLVISILAFAFAGMALVFSSKAQAPTSSITLNQTSPKLGDSVDFTVNLAQKPKNPVLILNCFQNQINVYEQRGNLTDVYVLGKAPSQWDVNGGPATCVANVYDVVYKKGQPEYMVKAVTVFEAQGK